MTDFLPDYLCVRVYVLAADSSLHQLLSGEDVECIPRYQKDDFLKQLCRDALWSDPSMSPGVHTNPRGE